MHIKSITLKNYRMFRDFTCDFDPGLTVLVADNGGGKTSILDAIRVALGPYLGAFPTGKGNGIGLADAYTHIKNGELGQVHTAFPVEIAITAALGEEPVNWSRSLASAKSSTTIRQAKPLTEFAKGLLAQDSAAQSPLNWPVLAYYGTGRLWNLKNLTTSKQFNEVFHGRAGGYIDCMDSASSYKLVLSWLRYAFQGYFIAKMRFADANPQATVQQLQGFRSAFSPLIDAVQQATNIALRPTGWKNLAYSETLADALVEHDEFGTMPVGQLSDGLRNTIGLVADLAYRSVQLNPHLAEQAACKTSGLVLIDEVDMHLHPAWQQTILTSLRQAFPKIQFIVTTHSPQVLSTVARDNIRILGKNQDGVFVAAPPIGMTYGEPSGRVLQAVMGVDPQPPIPEGASLRRLTLLVDQGHYADPDAVHLLSELTRLLGDAHPQLQRLQRSIARQEYLRNAPR